jgi:hypothetical protein
MENRTGISFFFLIIAIVTGSKAIKHFDFQTFRFEKPALDFIYLIAALGSIYALVHEWRKGKQSN